MARLNDYSELLRRCATTCPEHTPANGEDWRQWGPWQQCSVLDMIKGCKACMALTAATAREFAQTQGSRKQPVSRPRWWYELDHGCTAYSECRVYQWTGCHEEANRRLLAWLRAA
jgi:hypothetical protein